MRNTTKLVLILCSVAIFLVALSLSAQPKQVTISGRVMDLTCAAKAKAMMDSWHNAENEEHQTPDGPAPGCATMCLKGGQPAALFSKGKVSAIFACNPRATLSNYAAQDVEIQGFWGVGKEVFVPQKIRSEDGEWEEVNCATMHG